MKNKEATKDQIAIILPEPEEITPDDFIQSEVKKFDYVEAKIAEFKEFLKLTVSGIEDKKGFERVHDARMLVRDERISIDKQRKAINENALKLQKAVNAEAKRLTEALTPIEDYLLEQEKTVENEKERIRIEKIKAEEMRVQNRIAALFALGMIFNGSEYTLHHIKIDSLQVKELPDENWGALLLKIDEVKIKVDQEKKEYEEKQAEAKRLEEEQQAQARKIQFLKDEEERKAREAENARLEGIRKEQEKERLRLEDLNKQAEARNKKLQEEAEAMEKAHAEKVKALQIETQKLADQKKALEEQALKDAENKKWAANQWLQQKRYGLLYPFANGEILSGRLWELNEEEFQALYKKYEASNAELDKKRAEKEEADREAKIQANERIRQREESIRPDKEKLLLFAQNIKAMECPVVQSEEAQVVLKNAVGLIQDIVDYITDESNDL